MRGVWVVKPEAARSRTASSTSCAGTPEYYDVLARARVLRQQRQLPRTTSSSATGTVHVMTHHGTPLKLMGLDLQKTPGGRASGWTSTALLRRCRALGLQRLLQPLLDR